MSESRRRDALAVALLTLLPLLFFRGVVAGTADFFIRDVAHYYWPAKNMLRELVFRGEFPYWNPFLSAGQPLAANPEHEIFYPPNWLVFLPSFAWGFRALILVHLILAAVAMYALLRSMELRASSAFLGAVAFGLGGMVLSDINLLPVLFSLAWLPMTCLFARRFLLDRRRRDFALAALCLGMQFLAGEPTTVVQTAMLVGAYAVYRAVRDGTRLRPIALALAIGIAGLAAGAVQTLPALDHARDSVRAEGLEFELVSVWSMPPAKMLELVYPNVLGHVVHEGRSLYWGKTLYGRAASPYLFSIYAGLLIATMALAGTFARLRGWLFVLLLTGGSVLLALGANTPLLRLLYDAGIDFFRYYEKFVLIAVFAIVVFGAQALDRMLDGDVRVRRFAMGFAILVTAAPVLLARLWDLAPDAAAVASRDWIVAFLRGAGVLLLLWVLPRVRRGLWVPIASLFTIADLAPLGREIAPTTDASFYDAPAAVRRIAGERGTFRVFHEAQWTGVSQSFRRHSLVPPTTAEFGLESVMDVDYDRTALLPTGRFTAAMLEIGATGPLAAMSNAWYRVVRADRAAADLRDLEPVAFLPLPRQPRYFFAERVVPIRGVEDFVRLMKSGAFDQRTAFIQSGGSAAALQKGVVHAARSGTNDITLDVESSGRAYLVISVTPHKYWRATIDGRRVTPVVTNLGYQGLEIPRGRHVVKMRYRNPLILAGGVISLVALVALAGLCTMRAR